MSTPLSDHQYVLRRTGEVKAETLFGDRLVNAVYNGWTPGLLYRALTSARMSAFLALLAFDRPLASPGFDPKRFIGKLGIDLSECRRPETLTTPRKIFERRIQYEKRRPMNPAPEVVVSPADARMLAGSFSEASGLFIKGRFFRFTDLVGREKDRWQRAFEDADWAVFRLTPDKYHYNHAPVSGRVLDIYTLPGGYAPCNPGAVMAADAPYSKNRRVATVIDTDVPDGTQAGLVAMIEIVALMIGDIVQCYSDEGYDAPRAVRKGMFLRKGQPKSLYRPGSSTDVLLFQKGRVRFDADIVSNLRRRDVLSRFCDDRGAPMIETQVAVRESIGRRMDGVDKVD
jgi:phosphatidylserine decarboxylase